MHGQYSTQQRESSHLLSLGLRGVGLSKYSARVRGVASPPMAASPLEQLTNLPKPVAEDHLTENQLRARFVAKDVLDYADKAPKGLVLSSSAISRVLTVRDDATPHTETVSRVMKFLERFGGDDVYLKMHKGRRIAVFDAETAHRYGTGSVDSSRCDVISQRASG